MKTRKGRPRPDPGCSATDDYDDDEDDVLIFKFLDSRRENKSL
jgi:hypothetical protein